MECVIGYIKILCVVTDARGARLKLKNCGLTMMLFTNSYENHSRVYSRPYLTSVEVSKRCSNHIRSIDLPEFRFRFRWTLLTVIRPEFEHLIWYQIWWIYSYNINFTEHKLNWINQHITFVGKFLMKQTILFLHSQS